MGASDNWCQLILSQLEEGSGDMLLSAAELVHGKLDEQGGEFARWLRETFGPMKPENPAVIQTLAAFNLPLLTTNYTI